MFQQELIRRADSEKDDRISVNSIHQAAATVQREEFRHGQRIDIADAARIEIAGAGMVNGVGAPPVIIGGQRHHPENAADPIIAFPVAKESAMPAIMLDEEEPEQEGPCRYRQQEARHEAIGEREPDKQPQGNEGHGCKAKLDQALPAKRLPERKDRLQQDMGISGAGGGRGGDQGMRSGVAMVESILFSTQAACSRSDNSRDRDDAKQSGFPCGVVACWVAAA